MNWLYVPDRKFTYEEALDQRMTGTGTWFLQSCEYEQWKSGTAAPSIWLHGIPGCGKTVLSSIVVENLLKDCELRPNERVVHYFFDIRSDESRTTDNLLRSCTVQLTKHWSTVLPPPVLALYTSCNDGGYLPFSGELLPILETYITGVSRCYLIIDALDECADLPKLMKILETMQQWNVPGLHILVTSRNERDITNQLQCFPNIDISNGLTDSDIHDFIERTLLQDARMAKWRNSSEHLLQISKRLNEGANGMSVCINLFS
jgi:hypothetical protein